MNLKEMININKIRNKFRKKKPKGIIEEIATLEDTLVPHQKAALHHLRWFYFGNRATGRSYTLAVAVIIEAFECVSLWIDIIDHFPSYQANIHILQTIEMLLDNHNLKQHFQIQRNRKNPMIRYMPRPLRR